LFGTLCLFGRPPQEIFDPARAIQINEIVIVLGAPLLVGQGVVRQRRAREERLHLQLVAAEGLSKVSVGVEDCREREVRALDRLLVGRSLHGEHLVVIE
jgi:hypothetical protein